MANKGLIGLVAGELTMNNTMPPTGALMVANSFPKSYASGLGSQAANVRSPVSADTGAGACPYA